MVQIVHEKNIWDEIKHMLNLSEYASLLKIRMNAPNALSLIYKFNIEWVDEKLAK